MVCFNRPNHFKFYKGCIPKILLGLFFNILSQIQLKTEKNEITECDNMSLLQSATKSYWGVHEILQIVTKIDCKVRQVLQSVTGTVKCDRYCKVPQYICTSKCNSD